jgi:hypothetical protein
LVYQFTNIQLNNDVGNVQLKLGSGSTLKVNAKKILRNGTTEMAEELFKEMVVSVRKNGNTVYVETSGDKDKIFAKYSNVKNPSFEINFVLEAPSNLNAFNISTDVGEITATALTGSFKLTTTTGNIVLNGNTNVTGSSTIKGGVSSIDVRLKKFEASQAMNITTANYPYAFHLPAVPMVTSTFRFFKKLCILINH